MNPGCWLNAWHSIWHWQLAAELSPLNSATCAVKSQFWTFKMSTDFNLNNNLNCFLVPASGPLSASGSGSELGSGAAWGSGSEVLAQGQGLFQIQIRIQGQVQVQLPQKLSFIPIDVYKCTCTCISAWTLWPLLICSNYCFEVWDYYFFWKLIFDPL